tara:strand:- start:623 stop:1264 length:642 start_codon:yes stop_codon:yes gene_type:complete
MALTGEQIKGEPKTYKANQFNTTEGGLFLGHVMKNRAKMSVMLRRIFPSSFKTAQYIGLQQNGEMAGAIICSAPSMFEIICGEAPVKNQAGMWRAENGDIVISAPKGKIRLLASTIDLVAEGDGNEVGFVNINANADIKTLSGGDTKIEAKKELQAVGGTKATMSSSGQYKIEAGSVKEIEGGDFLDNKPGTGTMSIIQWGRSLQKLATSLAG